MSQQSDMESPFDEHEQNSLFGLDSRNNPIMDEANRADASLLVKQPVRDVDWREGPRPIESGSQRRAAYGQQCGMVVPAEHQCNRCKREAGVFASCIVNLVAGELQIGGACMNCVWTNEGYRCSHRQGKRELPACVQQYIADTAQTAADQADENTPDTEPLSTQVAQEANLNESALDEQLLALPLYVSPFQCRPSVLSWEVLSQISVELLKIQEHVNQDLHRCGQLFEEITRQQQ